MKRWIGKLIAGMMFVGTMGVVTGAKAQVNDPAGDFLPTFTGVRNGDLDVLYSNVQFDGQRFLFDTKMNGSIGLTSTGLYVLGFDRGAGTARFGALATGVFFDSVVTITSAGVGTVRDLTNGVATPLPSSAIQFNGNSITAQIPVGLLPSKGFATDAFTWNLWPRDSSVTGTAAISDFAPDNRNVVVQAVPEPGTLALLCGTSLTLIPIALRRRRRA